VRGGRVNFLYSQHTDTNTTLGAIDQHVQAQAIAIHQHPNATAKPGDIITIASPCHGARRADDLEAIILYCDQNGLVLTTAAVGMCVGAPVRIECGKFGIV